MAIKFPFSFPVIAHVHYDKNNWALIHDTLKNDLLSIDSPSRVRLVIDMFALAEAGTLSYDFVLRTMKYLTQEDSYPVWLVALKQFEKIVTV